MIIYKIMNKINGKIYIGQTKRTMKKRFEDHCCLSKSLISRAINKYNKDNFTLEEIFKASSQDELNSKEEELIQFFNCLSPNGYNLRLGGECSTFTDETKKKMSESAKTRPSIKESTRLKLSNLSKGEKHYLFGKQLPEEQRKILRDYAKNRTGDKNAMFNKTHTEEVKEAQSKRAGGSKNGMAKLNEENVLEIRRLFDNKLKNRYELSKQFNVTHNAICSIVNRKTWKKI